MYCLARAYGDEPLKRVAVDSTPDLTYVLSPSAYSATKGADGSGVGFPVECVFEYDEALFKRLRAAFLAADHAALWALWKTARPLARVAVPA